MTAVTHSLQRVRTEEVGTLNDLAAELWRLEETRRDYVVDTRRVSFNTYAPDDSEERFSFLTFDGDGHDDIAGGPVNEHAHSQIRERLGIPARYYDRMRADAPGLLDENVRYWFHRTPEKRMVRMQEGKVRAFLSNRYRRLDNIELMERAVLPELAQYGDRLVFHVAALTETRLYVRAIFPELAADVDARPNDHTFLDDGDVVQAGVEIRNSEVGVGSLSVSPFIWRLRCLNGLLVSVGGMTRYHIGRAQDEALDSILRDDTRAAEDRALWLKVRDAVGAALNETQFHAIVNQLREAKTGERIVDPVAATERLGKTYTLNEDEQGSVLRHLALGGDLTKWGAANAVTAMAKEADTFDRQAELEALGGALVALPEREWATIAR